MAGTKRTTLGRNRAASDEGNSVAEMGVGTGTVDPTEADTALGAEVVKKAKQRSTRRATGVIEHRLQLLVSEANGENLTEVGVWDDADDLVARATHAIVSKDESHELLVKVTSTWSNP